MASEVASLLKDGTPVRDRLTGIVRAAQPADIAVLFRSRDSHREFEKAIGRAGIATYVYKGLGFFETDEVQDVVALLRYLADPLSDLRAAALLRSRIVRLSDPAVARLAPKLAAAVLRAAGPAEDADIMARLSAEDRRVLAMLREAVPRWLAWVDRLAPSEILSAILTETAYAYETRGTRRRQARENLKKLGAMVRRFQNRGYATLNRVADHLEELALGDESNARHRRARCRKPDDRARREGPRVSDRLRRQHGARDRRHPSTDSRRVRCPRARRRCAIADYQSEADEDAQARDREETKRLLYVALTRARDRLYLSATVEDGVFRTGRGSFGDVLPASMKALFVAAAATTEAERAIAWSGAGARSHELVARRS